MQYLQFKHKHNKLKKLIQILLALSFFATISCSLDMDMLEDAPVSEIYGIWTDSLAIQYQGLRVEKLVFSSNSSFKYSKEGFGIYENQTLDEKSFSQEDFGSFVLSARDIYFVSKQSQFWDFNLQNIPEMKIEDRVLFESCTYRIDNDTLTLKFKINELNVVKDTTIILTRG
jgi:hypothetical protein